MQHKRRRALIMNKIIGLVVACTLLFAGLTGCSVISGASSGLTKDVASPSVVQADSTWQVNSAPIPVPSEIGDIQTPVTSAVPAEEGSYTSKDDVALYIHLYGKLPSNFITKKQAQQFGWSGGSLEAYAPGKCIGGSAFGNYEGLLPAKNGRSYTECDIDTLGASSRGAKRIVFSNDGLIYFTDDHYESFTLLYGDDGA